MKLTWKKSFFIVLGLLILVTGFNLYTYYSMKNANHELSETLNTAKNIADKLRKDNETDIATLKEAQENAQIVLNELNAMGVLTNSQREHLENAAGSASKIESGVTDAQSNTGSATENIDKAIESQKSDEQIFNDIDDILRKYGL
jgi:uncharacterized protein (UPF0333 family)